MLRVLLNGKLVLLVTLLLIFISEEVFVSQIHYDDITLEAVIADSSHVLKVAKSQPFLVEEQIPIDERDNDKYPPFINYRHQFRILEVLQKRQGAAALKCGDPLEVYNANYQLMLNLVRSYYIEGIMVSPIIERYRSGIELTNEGDDALFIFVVEIPKEHGPSEFRFTCDFAYESLDKEEEIRKIILTR